MKSQSRGRLRNTRATYVGGGVTPCHVGGRVAPSHVGGFRTPCHVGGLGHPVPWKAVEHTGR